MAAAKKASTKETGTTTLDEDVTKPSTTAPGDGPADTTDPDETAQSVPPQPSDEARAVGTVNSVKPGPKATRSSGSTRKGKDRVEKFTATKPNGDKVTVERNLDTGERKYS